MFRRLPKRGFTNINRKEYAIVNLDALNRFEDGAEVTAAFIIEIKRADLDARLVAENIARQLENRVSFRRAQKQAIQIGRAHV